MGGGTDYSPPVKRSVTIAGHETSIALEPTFWSALERAAEATGQPLNALIARIDAERLEAASPPNLASALRQWLYVQALGGREGGSRERVLPVRRDVEP